MSAMRAPQYQIVAVQGLIESEEQYQVCLFHRLFIIITFIQFRWS